ncbi:MAG: hypothetical protein IPL79_05335 [Myxococcales bacterium]|nr:hypothetical protein [Myxococcales bacterium]
MATDSGRTLAEALQALTTAQATFDEIDKLAGAMVPGVCATSSAELAELAEVASLAAQAPAVRLECLLELGAPPPTSALATVANAGALASRPQTASAYVALATREAQLRTALATRYDEALWELDIRGLKEAFAHYVPRNRLFRWFGLRGARRQLARATRGEVGSYDTQLADLQEAHAVVRVQRTLGDATPDAIRWFGGAPQGHPWRRPRRMLRGDTSCVLPLIA